MGFLLPLAGDLLGGMAGDAAAGAAEDAGAAALKGGGEDAAEAGGRTAEGGGNPLGDIVDQVLGGGSGGGNPIGDVVNQVLGGASGDSGDANSSSVAGGPLSHLGPGLEIPSQSNPVEDAIDTLKSIF